MRPPLRRARPAVVALLACVGAILVPAASHAAATPRLVVGFDPRSSVGEQAVVLRSAGIERASSRSVARSDIPRLGAVVLAVRPSRLAAVRRQLLARPGVRYVEVDHVARSLDAAPAQDQGAAAAAGVAAHWAPNDPQLGEQWALRTLGAAEAWELSRGTGVTIAILDSGVDYIHPDLRGRVDLGRDFVDGDDDPMDVQGHGTHVAGIAAAGADDGYGIAGIAPGARILAVRVLDGTGEGNYSAVANGIVHAVDRGARVINLSLGGAQQSRLLESAVNYAAARGAVVTCASGNESSTSVGYPGAYESCTSVGAVGRDDRRAAFSNRGPGLDLVAPGVGILSTTVGGSHEAWDGTSMAAPYASGVAALLLAQGLGRRDVLAAMTASSRDLGAAGLDREHGHGRLDAAAAVAAAARMPRRLSDAAAPTVSAVQLLPAVRSVRTTWQQRWKLRSATTWRRVGSTDFPGRYEWRRTAQRGTLRTVTLFRMERRVVYRRVVRHARVRVALRRQVVTLPVRVVAADEVGVDRVAVEVDGVTRGVDWSGADGWQIELPCDGGTHRFVGRAWDAADNAGSAEAQQSVRC